MMCYDGMNVILAGGNPSQTIKLYAKMRNVYITNKMLNNVNIKCALNQDTVVLWSKSSTLDRKVP